MANVELLPELADRLIDLANVGGGHDNVTCIVADFDGDALEPPEEGAVPFYQQYPLPRSPDERSASGSPLPNTVHKTVLRVSTPDGRTDLEALTEALGPVSFSWSTAASVLALLGLAAVITIASAGRRSTPSFGAAAPPPPAYADTQVPVEVKVRASLESGELYVNGRSYGPLGLDEAILLRLLPGSYHFEAREVDGTQVGKDVLVEAGLPTEVVLIPRTD
jgi:hypothetical protein